MSPSEKVLEALSAELPELRRRYGVRRLAVFGSHATGEAVEQSDVDLLVDLERSTFDDFMGLQLHLEDLLALHVDLVTEKALKPRLRQRILEEARDVT